MGDVNSEQCQSSLPAFARTGVDLFGSFLVKQGRSEVKRYGCIYTCLSIQSVHIEVLRSLESDEFLNGFFRFVAKRACPLKVFSDNGTNLVGAHRELSESIRKINQIAPIETAKRGIEWCFNPRLASQRGGGGVWERMIRTVWKLFMALLGKAGRMTDDVLHTVMCEIECIINGRPITKVSDDSIDPEALTPNHLLLMSSNKTISWGPFCPSDMYERRWLYSQYLAGIFWKRWTREYLHSLQTRSKWADAKPNLKPGDCVLVQDNCLPRGMWPLGLVLEVKHGRDELVRSAKMKMRSTELVRPVTKLVPFEGHFTFN